MVKNVRHTSLIDHQQQQQQNRPETKNAFCFYDEQPRQFVFIVPSQYELGI